ncbi:MAG: hypothetical protein OHK006_12850 [Thermodesulfovibrionales bacterium]
MGANYFDQDRAIAELSALSPEAKHFLNHHLGNSLGVIIGGIRIGRHEMAVEAALHIVADLELAGIRTPQRVIDRVIRQEKLQEVK